MNVEDARVALERKIAEYGTGITVRSDELQEAMAAADALGDAHELRGHVGACPKHRYVTLTNYAACGDDWYCPDAKEVTHDD